MNVLKRYYVVSCLYNLGIALFGGTLYLLMEQNGFSASDINIFLIVFWIVSFIFEIPSGIFADALGAKKAIIYSGILRSIGLGVLLIPSNSLIILVGSATLTAVSDTLHSSTLEAWVANNLQKDKLDNFFANSSKINTLINLVGGFLGAQILGKINFAYPVIGSIVFFMVSSLASLILIPGITSNKKNLVKEESGKLGNKIKSFKETIFNGLSEFKSNYKFRWVILSFIPSAILVTEPFNQWQLYFHESKFGESYLIGWILVGINISAILGARISQIVLKKIGKNFNVVLAILIINYAFIIISALVGNVYIAIIAFLVHTLCTSSEEVIRSSMLNNELNNSSRTMMLSVYNTVDSLVTILVLAFDSLLIHFMSIQMA